MSKCFSAALFLSFVLPVTSVASASAEKTSAPMISVDSSDAGAAPLLAKGKSKKKKKRKKAPVDESVPVAEGELHAKHEGVADEPYRWQASLLSDFSVRKTTQGEAKGGTADYSLFARAGYIIKKSIVVGGGLDYAESSFKADGKTNSASDWVLHLIGAYNFGNLDEDAMIFFAFGQFGVGQGKTTIAEESVKSSKTEFGLGVGMHYFMDTNVALTLEFSYVTGSEKQSTEGAEPLKYSTLNLARIGFSLFL